MGRSDSLQKTPMLGKTEGWERLKAGKGDDRGWDGWMASPILWTWVWVSSRSWWWTGKPTVHGVAKSRTRLSYWTDWIRFRSFLKRSNALCKEDKGRVLITAQRNKKLSENKLLCSWDFQLASWQLLVTNSNAVSRIYPNHSKAIS